MLHKLIQNENLTETDRLRRLDLDRLRLSRSRSRSRDLGRLELELKRQILFINYIILCADVGHKNE